MEMDGYVWGYTDRQTFLGGWIDGNGYGWVAMFVDRQTNRHHWVDDRSVLMSMDVCMSG
jgi:hypothetical protein